MKCGQWAGDSLVDVFTYIAPGALTHQSLTHITHTHSHIDTHYPTEVGGGEAEALAVVDDDGEGDEAAIVCVRC